VPNENDHESELPHDHDRGRSLDDRDSVADGYHVYRRESVNAHGQSRLVPWRSHGIESSGLVAKNACELEEAKRVRYARTTAQLDWPILPGQLTP